MHSALSKIEKIKKTHVPTMTIYINDAIRLELITEKHAQDIFDLVDANRASLRQWLSFVDKMQTIAFAENFVKRSIQRNLDGTEFAFVVYEQDEAIGRIGVYKIDGQNKIGEIGYWLAEKAQGKGIISKSCQSVIDFCFSQLQLNRIEIKCATDNVKSKAIPEKLKFTKEAVIRQGELLNGRFIDLDLYALLKQDV